MRKGGRFRLVGRGVSLILKKKRVWKQRGKKKLERGITRDLERSRNKSKRPWARNDPIGGGGGKSDCVRKDMPITERGGKTRKGKKEKTAFKEEGFGYTAGMTDGRMEGFIITKWGNYH